MAAELIYAFKLVDIDDRIKVVILTGAGRAFCAGADLEVGFPKGGRKNGTRNQVEEGISDKDHRDSYVEII